jgi:hypothetical protein
MKNLLLILFILFLFINPSLGNKKIDSDIKIKIFYEPLSREMIDFFNYNIKEFYKYKNQFLINKVLSNIEFIPGAMSEYYDRKLSPDKSLNGIFSKLIIDPETGKIIEKGEKANYYSILESRKKEKNEKGIKDVIDNIKKNTFNTLKSKFNITIKKKQAKPKKIKKSKNKNKTNSTKIVPVKSNLNKTLIGKVVNTKTQLFNNKTQSNGKAANITLIGKNKKSKSTKQNKSKKKLKKNKTKFKNKKNNKTKIKTKSKLIGNKTKTSSKTKNKPTNNTKTLHNKGKKNATKIKDSKKHLNKTKSTTIKKYNTTNEVNKLLKISNYLSTVNSTVSNLQNLTQFNKSKLNKRNQQSSIFENIGNLVNDLLKRFYNSEEQIKNIQKNKVKPVNKNLLSQSKQKNQNFTQQQPKIYLLSKSQQKNQNFTQQRPKINLLSQSKQKNKNFTQQQPKINLLSQSKQKNQKFSKKQPKKNLLSKSQQTNQNFTQQRPKKSKKKVKYEKNPEVFPPNQTINCYKGSKGCEANYYHVCAKNYLNKENYEKFLLCYFDLIDQEEFGKNNKKVVHECFYRNKFDYTKIQKCVTPRKSIDDSKAFNLLKKLILEKSNLDQEISHSPWILFDDVFDYDVNPLAEKSLLFFICQNSLTASKLKLCKGYRNIH